MSDSARSLPPLDEHLKSIEVNKARIARIYDHVLGAICDGEEFRSNSLTAMIALSVTAAYPNLPNRKRLVELVEQSMPEAVRRATEEAKP